MKAAGWLTIGLGGIAGIFSCIVDTSTSGGYGVPPVVNLGLMQTRDHIALLAASLFVAGVIMLVGGSIIAAIGAVADRNAERPATAPGVAALTETTPEPPHAHAEAATEQVEVPQRNSTSDTWMLFAGVAVVILVILAFAATSSRPPASTATAVENNADALADQMDALAANVAASSTDSEQDNPFK